MANKIDAPMVDAQVDPGDPIGSAKSVGFAAAGVALALAVFTIGQYFYNEIASRTPDAAGTTVEVF